MSRAKAAALNGEIAADVTHAAHYDAKIEMLMAINKELFLLEQRREKLFAWIKRMKILNVEATMQKKNEAEYQQQLVQQQQYMQQLMASLKENMPSLLVDCKSIIEVINREIAEHRAMIVAVQEVIANVDKIHAMADSIVKYVENHGKEIDAEKAELDERKKTADPKHAEVIDEVKHLLEHEDEIFRAIGVDQAEIARYTSSDGQMAQNLRSRSQTEEESIHTKEKMIAAVESIKTQAQQVAEVTYTELAPHSGRLLGELNIQDLTNELKVIGGAAAALQRGEMTVGGSIAANSSLEVASTVGYEAAAQFKALPGKIVENEENLQKQMLFVALMHRQYCRNLLKQAEATQDVNTIQSIKAKIRSLGQNLDQLKAQSSASVKNVQQMGASIINFEIPAAEKNIAALSTAPAAIRKAVLSAAAQGAELSGGSTILPGLAHHIAHCPSLIKQVVDHSQSVVPEPQPASTADSKKLEK